MFMGAACVDVVFMARGKNEPALLSVAYYASGFRRTLSSLLFIM
jgi:hypothetical protein